MSDYGLLEEVRIIYRGSTLTTAAAISDTELAVEYAGDFNYDPDDPDASGGTLDLNGARLAYTSITFGELVNDPDTIVLATPLTVAADADDFVGAVAGGQVLEDWIAYVTMGEGDAVHVPLSVDQRSQWLPGVYEDPVPVVVSDDLLHLEDAPGRTAPTRIQFRNTDFAVASGPGDIEIPLTFEPLYGSLDVSWNGLGQPPTEWSESGGVVTVPDPDSVVLAGDIFTAYYAYDPITTGAPPSVVSTLPVKSAEAAAASSAVTSLSVPIGTVAAGDLILLATGRATAPAGWTLVGEAVSGGGTHLRVYQKDTVTGAETSVTISGTSAVMAGVAVVIENSSVAGYDTAVEEPRLTSSFTAPAAPDGAPISFAMYDGPGDPPFEYITGADTTMIENLIVKSGLYGMAAATGQATFTSTTGASTSYWLAVTVGVTQ